MMAVRQLHVINGLYHMYKILNGMCNNTQVGEMFTKRETHYAITRPRILCEKHYASSYGWNSSIARITKLELKFTS